MSLRHAILLLALSGCGSDKQPAYTIETLPGGVVHVVNHGPSGWTDTLGWKIVLEAERTIPADSVGALLRPNYPHQLANGEVVILDQGEMFVQRYDADFNPIGQFGRRGSGPGEFVNPGVRGMGDSIAVIEGSRSATAASCMKLSSPLSPTGSGTATRKGACRCWDGTPPTARPE